MVTLRFMVPTDLLAILTIQQASPEAAQWSAEAWSAFLTPAGDAAGAGLPAGNCAWVAERNGEAAGFLAAHFSVEELEIFSIAVAPGARRSGVASRLLEEVLAATRSSGPRRAFLEVRASNAAAIAFYVRYGFLEAGRRKDYYSAPVEDALVLTRSLAVLEQKS